MICPLRKIECKHYENTGIYDPVVNGLYGCGLLCATNDDLEELHENDCPLYEEEEDDG